MMKQFKLCCTKSHGKLILPLLFFLLLLLLLLLPSPRSLTGDQIFIEKLEKKYGDDYAGICTCAASQKNVIALL
jgi:hypothetical protein